MQQLTDRQRQVLEFLKDFSQRKGHPPTVREIMFHFRLKSTKGVKTHLDVLDKKGYIKKTRKARDIEIIGLRKSFSIPLVGKVAAGSPILAEENIEGSIAVDQGLIREDNAFFLRVKGDSMTGDGILDGDYVLVLPQKNAENGDTVVALFGNEATVKKFYRIENAIKLEASNPAYEPIIVQDEDKDFSLIGKVTAIMRFLDKGSFLQKK